MCELTKESYKRPSTDERINLMAEHVKEMGKQVKQLSNSIIIVSSFIEKEVRHAYEDIDRNMDVINAALTTISTKYPFVDKMTDDQRKQISDSFVNVMERKAECEMH